MSHSLVLTRIGDAHIAFALSEVREVLLDVLTTPVPLSPGVISGLVNLRGEVLTAVDGPTLLGLPSRPPPGGPAHLVLRVEGQGRSLVVDEVLAVMSGVDHPLRPPPPTLSPRLREVCAGVLLIGDQLAILINGGPLVKLILHAAAAPAEPRRAEAGEPE